MNSSVEIRFLPARQEKSARFLALTLLIIAPFAFGFLALELGQTADWDLRNYHWYNAYAFLNHRAAIDFLPSQNAYFYNPLLDVPFYWLATHITSMAASYVLGFLQGLNFVLLFMLAHAALLIADPWRKVLICGGITTLGMLGGLGIAEIGTTSNDNIASLGILLSALLIIRVVTKYAADKSNFGALFLSGIPAGAAMGLKLTTVTFCIGLCLALLSLNARPVKRLMSSLIFGCGLLLGLLLTYGYWGWFLNSHFGSPFFPFFNSVFQSPMAPLTGGRDTKFLPHSLSDYLFFPFLFAKDPLRVNEIWWRDWRISILYGLLPLCLLARLVWRTKKPTSSEIVHPAALRFLLWTGVLSYVCWLGLFCIYRYLLPLEMLAPLLIVCAVGLLPLKPRQTLLTAGAVLLVAALSVHHEWTQRRASWSDHFVEATLPPLGETSDLMILMAGTDAYAHLVSQFPSEIPFVRIQGYFIDQATPALAARLAALVNNHQGRLLMLIPPDQHAVAQQALDHFHLAFATDACQPVIDQLQNNKLFDLCPLNRLQPSPD